MLPKLKRFFKKAIPILLILVFIVPIVSGPVRAFSTPTHPGSYLPNFEAATVKTDEMNLQSFVFETFKAVMGSVWYTLVGCMSCTKEEREKYPGFILGTLIAGIYANPPASGVKQLAKATEKLGITRPAYAQDQGRGFETMDTVMPIWKAFRNISYLFFVLILVFMGFAIMFRIKTSPQTVITIQSALPRIVLALILITFSYAIVGFLIDTMYVLLTLISNIFIGGGNSLISQLPGWGPELAAKVSELASGIFQDPLIGTMVGNGIFFFLIANMSFFAILFLGPLPFIISIIAGILIFIALIRIAWTLLKAYAMIIIQLIFAPFQIMIGVLPGNNAIGTWFRNILANLMVWPTIMIMIFIGSYLILAGIASMFENFGTWILSAMSATGFTLPALLFGGWEFFIRIILPFVGLGIILMAPKAADMIKAFMSGQPFGYGAAIGESLRGGAVGRMVAGTTIGGAAERGIAYTEEAGSYFGSRPFLRGVAQSFLKGVKNKAGGR